MLASLPQPKNVYNNGKDKDLIYEYKNKNKVEEKSNIPEYGYRKGFKPKEERDFGNGGAYPEIHIYQYPLNMGKKDKNGNYINNENAQNNVLALHKDENGRLNIEKVVLQNSNNKHIYATPKDLVPSQNKYKNDELLRPSEEEEVETTEKTKLALEKLLNGKIVANKTSNNAAPKHDHKPKYIKYQSQKSKNARVIKMVKAQVDPFDPAKFKHKRAPRGPPSPPVPVMHSPPRKLTKKDKDDWVIPPCVSNWKNIKGYTIPLDKRLAADGRGLQQPQVNDKFAKLTEALYGAERKAAEEIREMQMIKEQLLRKKREEEDLKLQKLAEMSRQKRYGNVVLEDDEDDEDDLLFTKQEIAERDRLRKQRKMEIEREMRLQNLKGKGKIKKQLKDRDVYERMALGDDTTSHKSGESLYDQRLFNQTQGIGAGFGSTDSYNVYDKPLFRGSTANRLFKPTKNSDNENYGTEEDLEELMKSTNKFKPDQGFEGSNNVPQRSGGPVAFERDHTHTEEEIIVNNQHNDSDSDSDDDDDLFGINEFLTSSKNKSKKIDKIVSKGMLNVAGGASSSKNNNNDYDSSYSSRKNINFVQSSSPNSDSHSSHSKKSRKRSRSRSRSNSPSRHKSSYHHHHHHKKSSHHRHRDDDDYSSSSSRYEQDRKRRKYR
eukprot:TRINITY_DN1108_c2_g4_i1.p1 TRINITY_DN1108_c2_g4~~TRINITY_DN1108_c2_g4_i1.p1  ORF type:complete len:660 (+),score=269.29 TRINITY_DN1108_c2_g4_i1:53-2032(+)